MTAHNVPNVTRKMGISPTHRYIPGVGWFTADDDGYAAWMCVDDTGGLAIKACTGIGNAEEPAYPLHEPAIIQPLGRGAWSKP